MSKPKSKIIRETSRVYAPVGARCRLCRLWIADEIADGVTQLSVLYGGRDGLAEGNELAALNRRSFVCDFCIEALTKAAE